MYVLSFLCYMILHVIIFGYIIKLHITTKCHTLYVGKTGVASECIIIAYRAWQFSAEVRACVRTCMRVCVILVSTPCLNKVVDVILCLDTFCHTITHFVI